MKPTTDIQKRLLDSIGEPLLVLWGATNKRYGENWFSFDVKGVTVKIEECYGGGNLVQLTKPDGEVSKIGPDWSCSTVIHVGNLLNQALKLGQPILTPTMKYPWR